MSCVAVLRRNPLLAAPALLPKTATFGDALTFDAQLYTGRKSEDSAERLKEHVSAPTKADISRRHGEGCDKSQMHSRTTTQGRTGTGTTRIRGEITTTDLKHSLDLTLMQLPIFRNYLKPPHCMRGAFQSPGTPSGSSHTPNAASTTRASRSVRDSCLERRRSLRAG